MYLVEFVYNGGSHPGSVRRVVTESISTKKISGVDIDKKELRHFIYEKMTDIKYWPLHDCSRAYTDILTALAKSADKGEGSEGQLARFVRNKLESIENPHIHYLTYFDGEWKAKYYSDLERADVYDSKLIEAFDSFYNELEKLWKSPRALTYI